MVSVPENLEKILQARYGEEVRGAIHDSIEDCYNYSNGAQIDNIENNLIPPLSLIEQSFSFTKKLVNYEANQGNRWIEQDGKAVKTSAFGWSGGEVAVSEGDLLCISKLITNGSGPNVFLVDSNMKIVDKRYDLGSSGEHVWNNIYIRIASGISKVLVNTWNVSENKQPWEVVTLNCPPKVNDYSVNDYSKITDFRRNLLSDSENLTVFFGAEKYSDKAGFQIDSDSPNGGLITDHNLTSNSNFVLIHVSGSTDIQKLGIQINVWKTDGSSNTYRLIKSVVPDSSGNFDDYVVFDAASYLVYENMASFRVALNGREGTGWCIVDSFDVSNTESEIRNRELYRPKFDDQMIAIFDKIDSIENSSDDKKDNTVLVSPNGKKWFLNVDDTGNLKTISSIPSTVLLMGNSLLLGMDTNNEKGGAFGMCASSPKNDWAYYVEEAIKSKNSSASFSKLHDAAFEQSENDQISDSYIEANRPSWSDKDLIIVQIGDNVNTDARRSHFSKSFPKLISSIKNSSPNGRIIIVGIWFSNTEVMEVLKTCASDYGCEFVKIDTLNTKENQATIGSTITYYDKSTTKVPEKWATHPGDEGMNLIANKIIDSINL